MNNYKEFSCYIRRIEIDHKGRNFFMIINEDINRNQESLKYRNTTDGEEWVEDQFHTLINWFKILK